MKQQPLKIPDWIVCERCGSAMKPLDGSRMFVCTAWSLHTRFLTWPDIEDLERAKTAKPLPIVSASDITW